MKAGAGFVSLDISLCSTALRSETVLGLLLPRPPLQVAILSRYRHSYSHSPRNPAWQGRFWHRSVDVIQEPTSAQPRSPRGSREGAGQCWLQGSCSTRKPCLLLAGRQACAKFPSELSGQPARVSPALKVIRLSLSTSVKAAVAADSFCLKGDLKSQLYSMEHLFPHLVLNFPYHTVREEQSAYKQAHTSL